MSDSQFKVIDILSLDHTLMGVRISSKKRVFELIANLINRYDPSTNVKEVIQNFTAREKLGSTGLGNGVALPHCKLTSCTRPVAAFLQLSTPVKFDSIDRQDVDLIFALIVPIISSGEYSDIITQLSRMFRNKTMCYKLKKSKSCEQLYESVIDMDCVVNTIQV